jgi:AbrB family looped-hinge helix DNA binding protein
MLSMKWYNEYMQVVLEGRHGMKAFESSVSPKGQITLPLEIRRRWGIKAKDRVVIHVDEQTVTIAPARSAVDESFGAIPPLGRPLSDTEMTELAAEEHAQEAAHKGQERR